MSRRILVVNPNTSPEVTEAYLAAARTLVPEDVTLTGVTGRFGARIVATEAEHWIAGHSALDLVSEHAAGHDAVILAISFDTALDAVRSVLPVPVIGITGAALSAAASGKRRVGVVFFGEVSRRLYERVLTRNGIIPVGMAAVDVGGVSDYLSPQAKDTAVMNACLGLKAQGAETIVICGAAIVGMAARLASHLPLPVFDGIEAVPACLAAPSRNETADWPRPLGESVGLSPSLARLLRGDMR